MNEDKRQQKAQELQANGVKPVEIASNKWAVGSERDSQTAYEVENLDGMWVCTCADFAYRGGLCKHIILCQLPKPEPTDDELRKVARFAASLDPEVVRRLSQRYELQEESK